MKQLTTTLLFLAMSIFSFAQTPLTEKMLNDHAQRLVANPIKWMKEDVSPNFVLSGSEGSTFNYQQTMALFEGVNVLTRELADVKISQYGNVAVATGIVTAKNTLKANGMPLKYQERFTYVLQNQNGKWILMSGQHTTIQPPASEDKPEEVVKQFVTEYNKDATAFFMDRCADNFRYTDGEGKFSGKDALKSDKTHTSDSEVSDMKSFQSGNLAVVNGIHIWKDAAMKVNRKVAFTYTLQKVNGK